ncbi:gamma-tubulin complex component 2 [Vairimorpha necatrix]|uniref:Gamma-tubulin complex component 2 n=1 Tax=Vairimorpha necatrix TaxID=6039 RepID=A0AAX4JC14_9MICR
MNDSNPLIDNLIFLLCGIDTSLMSIGMKNKKYSLLHEGGFSVDLLLPFEEICINVRIVHKFIFKNISSENSIKKIISNFLLEYKMRYLQKINKLRNTKDIETLYVSIQEDIEHFREFRNIIDTCRKNNDSEIFNNIKSILDGPFYEKLKKELEDQNDVEIINWIMRGETPSSFFIETRNYDPENLDEGYWKSKYNIKNKISNNTGESKESYMPSEFSSKDHYNMTILKCGKLTSLLNELDINYESLINLEIIKTRGISGTLLYLNDLIYNLLSHNINYELSILERFILMRDMSFFSDLFTDLYNDKSFDIIIYSKENKKFLRKINLFKKIDMINFKITDLDLNNTIYKIINKPLHMKNNQSILEFLTIEFTPKILRFLLTKKQFLELDLIFRFLFAFSVIQFFLQKDLKFRFSRLMLCFIQNFKFSIFSNIDNIVFTNVDRLVDDLNSTIMHYISSLFLVSDDIYLILSEIIDLSFNFIGLDKKEECLNIEEFESKFYLIINRLYNKLRNGNYDWWFFNTLEALLIHK